MDYYMHGLADEWFYSKFTWPRVAPSLSAIEVWKKFTQIITIGDQFLLSDMNHSRLQSCHREIWCRVNLVRTELLCKQNDTELFYRLHPTSRENFSTDLLDSNYSAIEESV